MTLTLLFIQQAFFFALEFCLFAIQCILVPTNAKWVWHVPLRNKTYKLWLQRKSWINRTHLCPSRLTSNICFSFPMMRQSKIAPRKVCSCLLLTWPACMKYQAFILLQLAFKKIKSMQKQMWSGVAYWDSSNLYYTLYKKA